jgi:AAT family amino acid transporter
LYFRLSALERKKDSASLQGGAADGHHGLKAFEGTLAIARIMVLVVITAALSSSNTDLYLSTRMLFSLSRGNYAPAWLGQLNRNGVPHRALAVSTAGMFAAILLAIFALKNAFLLLYGTAMAGMFSVWIVILLTHLRFRQSIGAETVAQTSAQAARSPPAYIGRNCCSASR